jgi:hypothetical protein
VLVMTGEDMRGSSTAETTQGEAFARKSLKVTTGHRPTGRGAVGRTL